MKKWILTPLLALACSALAMPAHAALLGFIPQSNLQAALTIDNANIAVDLYNLTGSTFDNLGTTVTENGSAFKIGTSVYYTNSHGLQSTVIGANAAKTLKTGTTLHAAGKVGTMIIVDTSAAKGASFLYDTAKKTSTNFSPAIHSIISLSVTADGKRIVLLGKNAAGKQKLYISTTNLHTLKELPLPTYAASCTSAKISPDGKQLFVGCAFNLPNKAKGLNGFVLAPLTGTTIGAQQRTVNTREIESAVWVNTSTLVMVDLATNNISATMTQRTVQGGKLRASTVLGTNAAVTVGASDATAMPYQVMASSTANEFYYSFMVVTSTGTPTVSTMIGHYNVAKKLGRVDVNTGDYLDLTEVIF